MAFQINARLPIYYYLFVFLSTQFYSAYWWNLYGDILKWKSNDTSKLDRIVKDLTINWDEVDIMKVDKTGVYTVFQKFMVLKTDHNLDPIWFTSLDVDRNNQPQNWLALTKDFAVLATQTKIIKISKHSGQVDKGIELIGADQIKMLADNVDESLLEVIVLYTSGDLWRVYFDNKTSKWVKFDKSSILKISNLGQASNLNSFKDVGVVFKNMIGLIEIDNLLDNQFIQIGEWGAVNFDINKFWNYGDISFNPLFPNKKFYFMFNIHK